MLRDPRAFGKSYFQLTFGGRIQRKSYWLGLMIWSAVGGAFDEVTAWPWAQMLVGVALLALAFKSTLVARRLHDLGLSAWWQAPVMAALVVIILANSFLTQEMINRAGLADQKWITPAFWGVIAAYWLLAVTVGLIPGSKQANKYGEPPLPEPILGL